MRRSRVGKGGLTDEVTTYVTGGRVEILGRSGAVVRNLEPMFRSLTPMKFVRSSRLKRGMPVAGLEVGFVCCIS